MRKNMYQSNWNLYLRGNKPISIATFSIATNPTDQFNIFKKYGDIL